MEREGRADLMIGPYKGETRGSGDEVGGGESYELAGSDDFGLFPEWGEMAGVAGDLVVGAGGVGAFEEDVVVGVGGACHPRKREERSSYPTVRAHPLHKTQRMGHPQGHLTGGIIARAQDPGKKANLGHPSESSQFLVIGYRFKERKEKGRRRKQKPESGPPQKDGPYMEQDAGGVEGWI
jgi:hypothetical protein